jgi:Uri superfamily endonuclease
MSARSLKCNPAPSSAGSYALVVALDRSHNITVGRRGRFHFPAGFYIYLGSALGPGGLAARLTRHLGFEKRWHWHIDYLLGSKYAHVVQVWTAQSAARLECEWACAAMRLPGASIVVPRFGASDCRCLTHLVGFGELPDLAALTGGLPASRMRIE